MVSKHISINSINVRLRWGTENSQSPKFCSSRECPQTVHANPLFKKIMCVCSIDEGLFPKVVVELAARRNLHHQHHLLLVLEYWATVHCEQAITDDVRDEKVGGARFKKWITPMTRVKIGIFIHVFCFWLWLTLRRFNIKFLLFILRT